MSDALGEIPVIGEPVPGGTRAAEEPAAGPRTRKPNAGWLTRIEYDPDRGVRAPDFLTPAAEYVRRFAVVAEAAVPKEERFRLRLPGMTAQQAFVPMDVRGTFLEPVLHDGRLVRWRPRAIQNKGELRAFHESEAGRVKLAREADFFGEPTDRGVGDPMRLIDQEFIPLTAGPFNKQLYHHDYLAMHARAFELTNHNAIAAAAIKIMTRFTLGRGISFHIKHDQARQVWERFWTRNNMRVKIRQMARDLPWQGELMLRYYEHTRGRLDVRVLDPSTVWEVVTDPDDVEKVYYYHQQYMTPFQTWVTGDIPSSRYIVAQVPPTNVQHVKINCSATERRGRSDLLPALAWFKRLNDFYNGVTVKALLEANLVWKIKVHGELSDVQALSADPALAELPPPGGLWWENDQVELLPVTAQLTQARASSGVGGELVMLIAASLNLPGEYFNVDPGRGTARATALVRTDPAVKTIEERQQLLRETIEDMYEREMATALARGLITRGAAIEEPAAEPDPEQAPDRGVDEEDWLADRRARGLFGDGAARPPAVRATLVRG